MRFQWLKDYQEIEEQILYLKWNLNKSKLERNRWVYGDLSNVKLEKDSRSSKLEENIPKIEQEIILLEKQKKEMLTIIQSFKGIENEIVKMKYVDGLSLDQISEKIGYSTSYIRKKHAEIRGKLDFLDDYEANYDDKQIKQKEIDHYYECEQKRKQLSLF
ncbi:hypothetical protein P7D81_20300 [Enterococcus avium]|uniref:hypothetical protein n=1 Tax=Enterococcus avium TaxID=33945 RepID=UPI0028910E00|nr:hypothetical protein [Enterococcus avium]MDT2416082.1 hypothetical protein [Enterococcus avium]MDT2476836.1 hypothetical protein [Enterococcus avium]